MSCFHTRTVFVVPGSFRVHHCAKVGSTAIGDAVRATPGCTGGRDVAEAGPEYRWGVVRHPLDRLVSAWAFFCSGGRLAQQPELREIGLVEGMTFAKFLNVAVAKHAENQHLRMQVHSMGPHPFNRLGRLENLSAEWDALRRRFPIIPNRIGHKNRSEHEPWQSYYSKAARKRAEKEFAADVALFEASDPNPPKE